MYVCRLESVWGRERDVLSDLSGNVITSRGVRGRGLDGTTSSLDLEELKLVVVVNDVHALAVVLGIGTLEGECVRGATKRAKMHENGREILEE